MNYECTEKTISKGKYVKIKQNEPLVSQRNSGPTPAFSLSFEIKIKNSSCQNAHFWPYSILAMPESSIQFDFNNYENT